MFMGHSTKYILMEISSFDVAEQFPVSASFHVFSMSKILQNTSRKSDCLGWREQEKIRRRYNNSYVRDG